MSDENKGLKVNELDDQGADQVDAWLSEDESDNEEQTEESTDEELAQDALDATEDDEKSDEESEEGESDEEESESEEDEEQTEEDAEGEKKDPRDGAFGAMRRKNREEIHKRDLEIAKLQGRNEVLEEMKGQQPPEKIVKSPLELAEEAYLEKYDELPAEGITMTSKLWREQQAFESDQSKNVQTDKPGQSKVSTNTQIALNYLQTNELSVEKQGEGRDLQTVLKAAEGHMTKGDLVDLREIMDTDGEMACLRETHKRALYRLEQADALPAVKAKKTVKPKVKAAQKKSKVNNNDVDTLLEQEDDTYTPDSESSEIKKLSSFLADATT